MPLLHWSRRRPSVSAEYIREALVDAGHVLVPRGFGLEAPSAVHDPAFVEFLRTAHARCQEEGRGGFTRPSGFPARGLRRDRVPTGINGAMGYAFDAGTPVDGDMGAM